MLENIVKALFSEDKPAISMSITQEGGLEVIQFNPRTNTVTKYIHKKVNFNPVKRIVELNDDFSKIIENIVEELGIETTVPVILTLPSMCLGFYEPQATINNQQELLVEVNDVVQQSSYMFKQKTPVVSCCQINTNLLGNNQKFAYTAIQEEYVQGIKNLLNEHDLKVIAVENSYASLFKALQFFNFINTEAYSHINWALVSINANSYNIFYLKGDNIISVYEEPVAIKAFDKEEVHYTMSSIITANLQNSPDLLSSVVIVNNSPDLKVKNLEHQFNLNTNLCLIENNGQRIDTFFNVSKDVETSLLPSITLFALGTSLYNLDFPFLLSFNLNTPDDEDELSENKIMLAGVPVEINDRFINVMTGLILALVTLIFAPIFIGVNIYNNYLETQISQLNTEINQLNQEMKKYEIPKEVAKQEFNQADEILKIMKGNLYNKKTFSSLNIEVPNSLWLTYFYGNYDKATVIRGESLYLQDIYKFFRTLKLELKDKNISLSKISLLNKKSNNRDIYEFEISNPMYKTVVDEILNRDENFQKELEERKKQADIDVVNSYFPSLPTSNDSILTPSIKEKLKRDKNQQQNEPNKQNILNLKNEKTKNIDVMDLLPFKPSQLPPT